MTKKVVLSVLFLCVLSGISLADISGPFTTTTPISLTLTDWSSSLAFPKFNPALGSLTAVQIDLSGSMRTVLTVTNNGLSSSSGTAKTELQMTVQDSGSNLIDPTIDMFSSNFNYTNLGAGQSVTSGILTKNGSSSDIYTLAAVLAEFTGPGTITLPAFTFTQTWLTNTGGNTSASQVTNASLTGSVTYSYDVPEPATVALLSLGGLLFKKSKK